MKHLTHILTCLAATLLFAPIALAQGAATDSRADDTNQDVQTKVDSAQQASTDRKAKSTGRQNSKSAPEKRVRLKLKPAEIKAALQFAEEHQPALANLIKKLKGRDSTAYERAINDLHLNSQRLNRMKDRQPQRFESEVKLWKVESEIRLQIARWAVTQNDRFERTVRKLLKQRNSLRKERLLAEKARVEARLKQLEEQIESVSTVNDDSIDREWTRLTKRLKPRNQQERKEKDQPD